MNSLLHSLMFMCHSLDTGQIRPCPGSKDQTVLMNFPAQICAVNLVVRDLESSVVKITPDLLTMESETVLTQYIIMNWTLAYNNISKHDIKRYYSGPVAMFLCRRPESRDQDDDY